MSRIVKPSLVVFFLLAMSAVAFGQSSVTGAIGGVVTNPNKEVIPGASVSVRNTETNKEDTATTDGQGRFQVINLQPGNYMLTVNATGFGVFTQDKVVVEVGRVTSLDVPLAVGQVQGTVEVTAEAPVINTTQPDFSTNINQVSINELPNNGRRWANFALGTPGAVADGGFGLISFRGISGLLNNNTIDGADDNQAFFSEERGRTRSAYAISQAAVREYQVNTSNYSAEYGRAAGGVVNAVTKSGTNQFHGSAFIYARTESLNARNPSTFVNGVAVKPKDRRQQFGGTVGGPIMKNKLFFFFSYDQQKRDFPGVAAPSSPTFFTTVDRPTLISRGLTDAQVTSAVTFAQSLSGVVARRGDQTLILPKVDWRINDKHTLTFTYNRLHWVSPRGIQTAASVTRGINSFGDDLVDVNWGTLRLTSSLSPTILNEARVQIGRDFERQVAQPPAPGEPTTAVGGSSPSIFTGTNGFTIGKPNFLNRSAFPDERRQQYADTVTLTRSNHTFKFGADINHVKDVSGNLFQESGVYSYTTFNDFIIDYANFANNGTLRTAGVKCISSAANVAGQCYSGNFSQGFGPTTFIFSTNDYNFFFQDDWRYTPRLTVNVGLRYEYQQLPKPQIPNALFDSDPQFIDKTNHFPADKNNFGPRIGFAWDMTGDGKNSLRGGYGIYYGRITNSAISNAITNTGVAAGQVQVSTTTAIFPNVFAAAAAAGAAAKPNIVVFESTLANPQIHETDLSYERLIAPNTVASVSYLGSFGRRLPQFVDINLAPPTATTNFTVSGGPFDGQIVSVPRFTTRLNTNFNAISEVQGSIRTTYHALALQLNRRFTKGLQYQASYTFARALDNGQNSSTFTDTNDVFNPYNPNLERGFSNFDVRHKFGASVIWHPNFFGKDNKVGRMLLNGFNISPILSAGSGSPYSAGVSGSIGNVTGLPNPVAGGSGITGSGGGNRFPITGRNSFRNPKIVNVDLRVSRRFRFTETMNLELLAEGFNIFNRSQIVGLNTTEYSISNSLSGTKLIFQNTFQSTASSGTANFFIRERQLQFALRFEF